MVGAGGRPVGYTDLHLNPANLGYAHQGRTVVHPAHRNLGLGRWLKAANLLRLLEARPSVRVVHNYNADINAAVLGINRQMGFRPNLAHTEWQFEASGARVWLAARAVGEGAWPPPAWSFSLRVLNAAERF